MMLGHHLYHPLVNTINVMFSNSSCLVLVEVVVVVLSSILSVGKGYFTQTNESKVIYDIFFYSTKKLQ